MPNGDKMCVEHGVAIKNNGIAIQETKLLVQEVRDLLSGTPKEQGFRERITILEKFKSGFIKFGIWVGSIVGGGIALTLITIWLNSKFGQ